MSLQKTKPINLEVKSLANRFDLVNQIIFNYVYIYVYIILIVCTENGGRSQMS